MFSFILYEGVIVIKSNQETVSNAFVKKWTFLTDAFDAVLWSQI